MRYDFKVGELVEAVCDGFTVTDGPHRRIITQGKLYHVIKANPHDNVVVLIDDGTKSGVPWSFFRSITLPTEAGATEYDDIMAIQNLVSSK